MNHPRLTAVVAFACAIPFATASAQSEPVEPLKWSLSLGADPTSFDLRTRDTGVQAHVVGNLTRIWQSPDSRFSRKISLMLGGDSPRSQENCYQCWERAGKRYAGLTASTSVDLFRVSRFTPYVQTGAGIYYTRLTSDVNGVFIPSPSYDRSHFSFGINGGLGIRARLGSHEFFVEQMLHAFDVRVSDKGVYPLNFGFRF